MCDSALKSSEIIWYPEQKRHEEYCLKCRQKIGQDIQEAGWEDEICIPTEDEVEDDERDAHR
jgi:hypothetical protein